MVSSTTRSVCIGLLVFGVGVALEQGVDALLAPFSLVPEAIHLLVHLAGVVVGDGLLEFVGILVVVYALQELEQLQLGLVKALYVFFRERKRYRKTIVISPEGIKTEEGELVKTETIDHCYLHFCDMFIRGGKYDSIDKRFYRLIVVFKDGRKKRIDLEDYGVSFKRAESFHKEVNAIPGMPLFVDPIIEHS